MLAEELNALSGVEFESLCASLIAGHGFQVELTKASGDGGIDIIAFNSSPLFCGKYIIQCKRYTGTVGEPILRDLYGVVMSERANKGILMTTGTFTRSALSFAEGKPLELIDINGMLSLLSKNDFAFSQSSTTLNEKKIHDILEKGYNEDTYDTYLSEHRASPFNISLIGKLAYWLYSWAVDSIWNRDYSIEDRRCLTNGCIQYLSPLLKYDLNAGKDKQDTLRVFVLLWLRAQASFLSGNYTEAKISYSKILEWEDLVKYHEKTGLMNCLYSVVIDIISFYSAIGEKRVAEKYLSHPIYGHLISLKKAVLEQGIESTSQPHIRRYRTWIMDDLDSVLTRPSFHPLCIHDKNLFENTFPLYDRATGYYNEDVIISLLSPDICRIENTEGTLSIITEDDELIMIINKGFDRN